MESTQETINNAKQLHSLSWISPELKSALENDFPELKENEDEKIREDLIGGLMWQRDNLDRLSKHDDSLILPGFCHTVGEHLAYLKSQKEQNSKDEEYTDFTIYHPTKNGKGEYECIPYSFYGSLTSFSENKDLIDFLRTCFYTEEECNKWIEQQKDQKSAESDAIKGGDFISDGKRVFLVLANVKERNLGETGSTFCESHILGVDGVVYCNMDNFKKFNRATSDERAKFIHDLNVGVELKEQPTEWNEDYRDEDLQTRFAFYTYKDDDDVLYLSNVFVEETSRNNGFGTKILAAAEKVAETIGATNIRLKVKRDSPASIWYRKHGYKFIAFEDDYDWLEKILEYQKPSKPGWSERDKSILNNIVAYKVLNIDDLEWLKSIPERFNLQPKQEWSKEDKNNFNRIAAILVEGSYSHPWWNKESLLSKDEMQKLTDWLKSLLPPIKDREMKLKILKYLSTRCSSLEFEEVENYLNNLYSSWKPSEEQMEYLAKGIVVLGEEGNCKTSAVLSELRDDLQKLL